MFTQPAVFVDIETNGKFGAEGKIIEIGILRVEGGAVVEEYNSLVNPGERVPYWIEKLTGISDADLVDAPYFDEIAETVQRLFDGAIFVAHNVRFDYSFLKSHLLALGHTYRPKLFCTVRLSRGLYPEFKGHSLEKIITRHKIPVTSRHRAFEDARAAYEFTQIALREKGVEAFEQNVAHQLKTKSLPPNIDNEVVSSLPAAPGVYIFNDESGNPLYVGKSVNIRERVRSHFTNDTKIVKEMKLAQRSFAIESKDLSDLTNTEGIYGVYTSRMQAKSSLESLTKTFQLCPKLMGLEKATDACFRYQLGFCKGACINKETAELYNRRAELALLHSKIESWPFASKIAITISPSKSLLVNQWIIEGIVEHEFEPTIEPISNGFDIDTYKILRSYIRRHPQSVRLYDDDVF